MQTYCLQVREQKKQQQRNEREMQPNQARAKKKEMNERIEEIKMVVCGIWVAIKLSFGRVTFTRKFEHT